MTVLLIGVAVAGAYICRGSALFVPAVINAIASAWGNGVLANFRQDPDAAPNAAAAVSMVTTLVGIGFIVAGVVVN